MGGCSSSLTCLLLIAFSALSYGKGISYTGLHQDDILPLYGGL